MTKEEVFESLKEIIKVVRPTINLENVNYDTRLIEDLSLDSLSMMLTAMAVENKLGIRFSTESSFRTVGDVCDSAVELLSAV
ncbi:MAG: hypothetical protein J5732_07080 [Bacteroidaceae bacterium]|nr:hypothetical protein [Bacteroidaceae bacterium]